MCRERKKLASWPEHVQKLNSTFCIFECGDCFEHWSHKEETNDQKGKRREKEKAQRETLEEVVSIVGHLPILSNFFDLTSPPFFKSYSPLGSFCCKEIRVVQLINEGISLFVFFTWWSQDSSVCESGRTRFSFVEYEVLFL